METEEKREIEVGVAEVAKETENGASETEVKKETGGVPKPDTGKTVEIASKPGSEEAKTGADMNPETEERKQIVSTAPFFRSRETTGAIMREVVIALLPAALFGVYRFGFRAFLILLLSVTSCVLSEHIYKRIRKTENGGYECSAVVTGLIFGMMLPADVPYWFPILGSVFAIVIVKMLFGGLGKNLLNPAVAAKLLFLILTGFIMKEVTAGYGDVWEYSSLFDLFFGYSDGMIGEVSTFLVLLGGLYLVVCKVISVGTPAAYLLSFAVVLLVFGDYGFDLEWLAMQLCSGGVMLGAFFLATDYTTSPVTKGGRLLFGVLLGVVTGVLRVAGYTAYDVTCAILLGNVLTPLLEKITVPRFFGKGEKVNL